MKEKWIQHIDALSASMRDGSIDRRTFLKNIAALGAAAGILGLPGLSHAGEKRIRFDSWGGIVSEAFRKEAFAPFYKATGIRVEDGEFGDMDTYLSRVKASYPPGGRFNLAHLSGVFDYARYVGLGFDSDLDAEAIPNLKNVMQAMIRPLVRAGNGRLSAIPYDLGQTGIAYNTKYVTPGQAEKAGASLLWEKSLSGRIGAWTDWRTNIWYAALHTGQNPNHIEDMEAVWNALSEQRKMVRKYWSSGAEKVNLLATEEILVTAAWSGRVAALQEQGYPIGFLAPENAYSWMNYIFVLKGTDLDIAGLLLNALLEPSCAFAVALAQKYPPSLDPTKVAFPDAVKQLPAFDPSGRLEGYLFADPAYWNRNEPAWSEKWDRIRIQG